MGPWNSDLRAVKENIILTLVKQGKDSSGLQDGYHDNGDRGDVRLHSEYNQDRAE